jgi:hypothetical protein
MLLSSKSEVHAEKISLKKLMGESISQNRAWGSGKSPICSRSTLHAALGRTTRGSIERSGALPDTWSILGARAVTCKVGVVE